MKRWIIGIVIVAVLLVVGGPFVYFHFIQGDPPPKLSLATTATPTTVPGTKSAPLAGTWTIGSGSVVRYRVKETLFGQSSIAVGSTPSITGSMTIAGTTLTTAGFTVDMTTFTSNQGQRDGQFQGRIMDTADFPTATFTLTKPVSLAPVPQDGAQADYSVSGKLLMHGQTKAVTVALQTRRTGNVIQVVGSTPITFADYDINNPSGGPASVGDSGTLEFTLQLQPK